MTTLLSFLFVLGVLIFVHELGHFLVARRHGVRVLTFSLGFGPKILKVTRGDTFGATVAKALAVGGPSMVEVDMHEVGELPPYFPYDKRVAA